ncbi:MAG: PHP domain-containing protein, partial [Desulfovibrio sp.]|nr:PHP domain-containing protein [Desulfovibrio sp.]
MIIDLHLHESLYSACSWMSVQEAVAAAGKQGLDAICITNHDSMDIRESYILKTMDFPVFVGVEFFTDEGEIIAIGLDSLPEQPISAQDFIDFVNEQNGFCFAAHPFRTGCWLGERMPALKGLHGVEVCNGGNLDRENEKAWKACRQLGLIAVGGSDAHMPKDVGR